MSYNDGAEIPEETRTGPGDLPSSPETPPEPGPLPGQHIRRPAVRHNSGVEEKHDILSLAPVVHPDERIPDRRSFQGLSAIRGNEGNPVPYIAWCFSRELRPRESTDSGMKS